mmetsp:Transcript_50541/g.57249  ORF Transcript_50541/g.57249 Transcript_50541/m.57249 type:complete len:92 (+) Transcript_50541:26-301(+)
MLSILIRIKVKKREQKLRTDLRRRTTVRTSTTSFHSYHSFILSFVLSFSDNNNSQSWNGCIGNLLYGSGCSCSGCSYIDRRRRNMSSRKRR